MKFEEIYDELIKAGIEAKTAALLAYKFTKEVKIQISDPLPWYTIKHYPIIPTQKFITIC